MKASGPTKIWVSWITDELSTASKYFPISFLGAFEKSETRLLALSYLSLCPRGTTRLSSDGFWWNFIFKPIWKICRENKISVKSDKNNAHLHEHVLTFITMSSWILPGMRIAPNHDFLLYFIYVNRAEHKFEFYSECHRRLL